MQLTIQLFKPAKGKIITYQGRVLERDTNHILVHARWEYPRIDVGYVVFEPGDHLYEHFYSDRWYNVYEMHAIDRHLKGWYCNITRPAVFHADRIESEDLELDMFVPPDRRNLVVLDMEEYAARGIAAHDPEAHRAVMAALDELRCLAERSEEPFHPTRRLI